MIGVPDGEWGEEVRAVVVSRAGRVTEEQIIELLRALRDEGRGFLVITHYQRLLNHIKPDFVHVLVSGKIVQSGGPEVAHQLEENGYDELLKAHGVAPEPANV